MAVVPVGAASAIGAVGAYWATAHHAAESNLETLKALADSAFLAIGAAEPGAGNGEIVWGPDRRADYPCVHTSVTPRQTLRR